MPNIVNPDDLETFDYIVTREGLFDAFDNTTYTNNNFSDNSNNVGSFSQAGGLLSFAASGSVNNIGVKYQDWSYLTPGIGLPWPIYVNCLFEAKFKIDGVVNFVGISLSHADENFGTAANKFWAGVYYNSGVDNGVRIIGNGVTSNYSATVNLDPTEHLLQVVLKYNAREDYLTGTPHHIKVDVYLDGTLIVSNYQLSREDLTGYRLDGFCGLAVDTPISGGDTDFLYFCCNRVEGMYELEYKKTTLYQIGDLTMKVLNDQSSGVAIMQKGTMLNIYGKSPTSWQRRWHGFVDFAEEDREWDGALLEVSGYHFSSLLDRRSFIGEYQNKTTDFIIGDSTYGVFPLKASDIVSSSTYVTAGDITTSKKFYGRDLRDITIELAGEEDALCFLDENDELHFEEPGSLDSGLRISYTDSNLLDYNLDNMSPEIASEIHVHSARSNFIVQTNMGSYNKGGFNVEVLVRPNVTSLTQAESEVKNFILRNEDINIVTVVIELDYGFDVGYVVTVTLDEEEAGIVEKRYIVSEITEKPLLGTMAITLLENTNSASDLLFSIYSETKGNTKKNVDKSADDNPGLMFKEVFELFCFYEIEVDTGSGYVAYESGKMTLCQRQFGIVPGAITILGSAPAATGISNRGLIGDGTTPAKTTDQYMENAHADYIQIAQVNSVQTLVNGVYEITETFEWDTTKGNGIDISEFGWFINYTLANPGSQYQLYEMGEKEPFAPYNVKGMLHGRCTFTPFTKDNTKKFKVKLTAFTLPANKSGNRKV